MLSAKCIKWPICSSPPLHSKTKISSFTPKSSQILLNRKKSIPFFAAIKLPTNKARKLRRIMPSKPFVGQNNFSGIVTSDLRPCEMARDSPLLRDIFIFSFTYHSLHTPIRFIKKIDFLYFVNNYNLNLWTWMGLGKILFFIAAPIGGMTVAAFSLKK